MAHVSKMMAGIGARLIKKIVFYLGQVLRSLYVAYLRSTGVRIGKHCMISLRAKIDSRRGKVIIGDNVTITYGVVILSHDASAKRLNPNDNGEGTVIIEDGVFIGVNSVVLRNVRIGKNSVIGAGSVITKDIPANAVAVGNPCRVIRFRNSDCGLSDNLRKTET